MSHVPNPQAERDRKVFGLKEHLAEIEQRLIPTGLHIFGRPSSPKKLIDTLRLVAAFDRPERGARALTDLIVESAQLSNRVLAPQCADELLDHSIQLLFEKGINAAAEWLREEAGVEPGSSYPMLSLLSEIQQQLKTNSEGESLLRALRGEYIEAGPGADLIQDPAILPTGRNTHAINPYLIPSAVAFTRAEVVTANLLSRYRKENNRYPYAMALVLWGLDNIKTQGEGVAQALWLLGVRPVLDGVNRACGVEPIPLERLGRPRIDVVMTVSGIFRDLFSPTMQLLDNAVRLVAGLDESPDENYVRRHVLDQVQCERCEFDEAATRLFSNAPGSYGTNVNFMVMDSQWDQAETLGDLFVTRKCFAYGRDSKGISLQGREARSAMDRALSRVEVTYQNIDTFEIGITDVDHYFEYLGGISKAVEKRSQQRPSIYVADSLSPESRVRTLEETVRLETRAKTLNPKWFEGMLKHGFRGVAEIENHVTNTFGWSATADAVDEWIYTDVAQTFLFDEAMLQRLKTLNPHSAHALVGRLLEANGRGFWNADETTIEKLRDISNQIEDRIEGIA